MRLRRPGLLGRRAGAVVVAFALALAVLTLVAPDAGAVPTMTVTPDTDVVDGTLVTVRGVGFTPGLAAASIQCSADVETTEAVEDCDLGVNAQGVIAPDGTIELSMRVRRFIEIRGDTIDCAEPDTCMVVLVAGDIFDLTYDEAAGVPIVFDPRFPEPPPEIGFTVDDVTAQLATVTLDCSAQTDIELTAEVLQRSPRPPLVTRPRTHGELHFRCNGVRTVEIPMFPRHAEKDTGRRLFPMRSLVPGPATLRLSYRAFSGEHDWRDTVRRPAPIADPTLPEGLTVDHPQMEVRLLDVRIGASGHTVADVEVTCDRPGRGVHVNARAVTRVQPDTFRAAIAATAQVDCTGAPTQVQLGLTDTIHRQRDDIVPAGPVEVYVTAGRTSAETAAADFVPITTERPMRPRSIRVHHHPRSRIEIGDVTAEGVAATFRCTRDAPFTVIATLGQPVGTLVFNDGGAQFIECRKDETVGVEIPWEGRIIRPVRSAVAVRAIKGYHSSWVGESRQNQGAWRNLEAAG